MFNNTIIKFYGWTEGGGGIGGGPDYDGGGVQPDDGTPPGDTPGGGDGSGDGTGGDGDGAGDDALTTAVDYMNMDVKYFKINLESTKTNMYGESLEKWYYPPLQVKCIVERAEIVNGDDEFGVTVSNDIVVKIPRSLLSLYGFLPEVGDIVMDRDRMYEINSIDQNFITLPGGTGAQTLTGDTTGVTVLFILKGYLTRVTKLNLIEYYQ